MEKGFREILIIAVVVCLAFALQFVVRAASAEDCPKTYENFGKAFLDKYCNNCHSSAKKGFARKGAPDKYNYDDLAVIKAEAKEMVEWTVDKKKMPPGVKLTDEQYADFKAWIECEYN